MTAPHTIGATFAANNPTATVTDPAPNAWISGTSFGISGTAAADFGHAIDHVDVMIRRSDGLYWDGISQWTINPTWLLATGTTSWSYDWQPLPAEEGAYTYSIDARATDSDAVAGTASGVSGVRVDNVAPSGSVSINAGATYTTSTSAALALSATDGGSGIAQMRFSIDGTNWSSWEQYGATKSLTLAGPDGTKTVYVQFADTIGNQSGSFTDTIILDTASPSTIRTDAGGTLGLAGWYTSPPSVTLVPTEAGATAYSGWNGSGLSAYLAPLTPAEGTSTLSYRSVDLAGNAETTQTAVYYVDTIAPAAPTATASNPTETSIDLSWGGVTDSGSGIAYYEIRVGASVVGTTAATSRTMSGLAPNTSYTYTVNAVDVAGNQGASSAPVAASTLAAAAPTTTTSIAPSSANGSAGWYLTTPLITLTSNLPGTTYYSWAGPSGPWSAGTSVSVPSGTNTLWFYSTAVGSADETPKSFGPVRVDITAPGTPVVAASNVTGSSVDLSWTAVADAHSGVGFYEIRDGASLVATTSGTTRTMSGLVPGSSHTYTVTAVDVAGNSGSASAGVPVTTSLNGAPTTTLSAPPPNGQNGWYASAPLLTLDAGAGAITYYSWASVTGPWSLYTGPISGLAGTNTLYFYSTKVGSTDETPKNSGPIRVDTTVPGTPSPTASNVTASSATISWPAVSDTYSGVAQYRVYDAADNVVATTSSTSAPVSGLTQSSNYTYRVRAYDNAGNQSALGAVTFTTQAGAPQPFPYTTTIPAANSSTNVTLNFYSVTTTPTTAAAMIAPRQPVPASGLTLVGSSYYDITSTPVYSSFIEVTMPYSEADLNGATESTLQMWHYRTGVGWENVTVAVNTTANTITGRTTSFSDFAIYASNGPAPPVSGVPATSTWSVALMAVLGGGLLARRSRRGGVGRS